MRAQLHKREELYSKSRFLRYYINEEAITKSNTWQAGKTAIFISLKFSRMGKVIFIALSWWFVATPPIPYRQLVWSDYKGIPTTTEADACTCTNIVIGIDTAYAIFIPEKSWTRTSSKELLRHEQIHFWITNQFAKQIARKLKAGKSHGEENNCLIFYDEWRQMEAQYDLETDHGRNIEKQKKWEEKIKM